MRPTRVFVDCALAAGSLLDLPADAAAHVAKVLRARSGDELTLFNGAGGEFAAAVESVRGGHVRVLIGAGQAVDRESRLAITLVQCIPRGDRMDFIVQKATELGVAAIAPVLSERSVVRLDPRQSQSKRAHWHGVAVSACEQCGRNRLPRLDAPQMLLDHLGAAAQGATRLVLEPDCAEGAVQGATAAPASVELAIGPEGGFTGDELEAFRIAGFSRVRLGPRILRTETAAIAAIAWLQARWGDLA
jgi:16S rRNA (uracil1498-N3)-methyltransferase